MVKEKNWTQISRNILIRYIGSEKQRMLRQILEAPLPHNINCRIISAIMNVYLNRKSLGHKKYSMEFSKNFIYQLNHVLYNIYKFHFHFLAFNGDYIMEITLIPISGNISFCDTFSIQILKR